MKKILFFIFMIASLFIIACQQNITIEDGAGNRTDNINQPDSMNRSNDKSGNVTDHIGCQEGEIQDGICVIAPKGKGNVDLFENISSLEVEARDVRYGNYSGFLAMPVKEGEYPAVIMIHEWWGLNDNIKDMARLLADEGYIVLAVDLYSGRIATDSTVAQQLVGEVMQNQSKTLANMQSAADYLRDHPRYNGKLAVIGWCFGGGQSLQLAISGEELDAAVIYYGQLVTDRNNLSRIETPILGIFGENDTSIPLSRVREFENALTAEGIQNDIYIYEGVGHAFANPSGMSYSPNATIDAWNKTLSFLANNLEK